MPADCDWSCTVTKEPQPSNYTRHFTSGLHNQDGCFLFFEACRKKRFCMLKQFLFFLFNMQITKAYMKKKKYWRINYLNQCTGRVMWVQYLVFITVGTLAVMVWIVSEGVAELLICVASMMQSCWTGLFDEKLSIFLKWLFDLKKKGREKYSKLFKLKIVL